MPPKVKEEKKDKEDKDKKGNPAKDNKGNNPKEDNSSKKDEKPNSSKPKPPPVKPPKPEKKKIKVLFILKDRAGYGYIGPAYGLSCSCLFVCNALREKGIECKVVRVVDGNDVEREVFLYQPTHVIGEAYWIPSEKFNILCNRYKDIFWTVRSHSKIPFFQNEGTCIQFTKEYGEIWKHFTNFVLSSNTYGFITPIEKSLNIQVDYLPNIYKPNNYTINPIIKEKGVLKIGLFGAIRIQKNLLLQALAAMDFADSQDKKLKLYINSNRVERGEPVLKNLESLFKDHPKHELIKISWMEHIDFIELVRQMDLMMTVSDSESFSIISADGVSNDIPTIGSAEIEWMSSFYQAESHNFDDIVSKLKFADFMRLFNFQKLNKNGLLKHNKIALETWMDWLKKTLIK